MQAWSTDSAGMLSVMQGINQEAPGAVLMITMHGSSMGASSITARMQKGQTEYEGTEWESEMAVMCRVGQGTQGTRRSVLTVGEQLMRLTQAWSADTAGLSVIRSINHGSGGSSSMTVEGSIMGAAGYTTRFREGHTGCESTEWVSETSVRCKTTSQASGSKRAVITTGQRQGSITQFWWSDAPGISRVNSGNLVSVGSVMSTVHGVSMGDAGYTARMRLGQMGCEGTEWKSETSVRCQVGHMSHATRRSMITVGSRGGSMTEGWSVDTEGLSVMGRTNLVVTGSSLLTVHGSGMGVLQYTARARQQHSGCEASEWESETSLRCRGAST